MGPDHSAFGRAKHPFMTGTGGWSYFAATRYILEVRPQFGGLLVAPCLPADWGCYSHPYLEGGSVPYHGGKPARRG